VLPRKVSVIGISDLPTLRLAGYVGHVQVCDLVPQGARCWKSPHRISGFQGYQPDIRGVITGYQEKIDEISIKYLIDFSKIFKKYLLDIRKY